MTKLLRVLLYLLTLLPIIVTQPLHAKTATPFITIDASDELFKTKYPELISYLRCENNEKESAFQLSKYVKEKQPDAILTGDVNDIVIKIKNVWPTSINGTIKIFGGMGFLTIFQYYEENDREEITKAIAKKGWDFYKKNAISEMENNFMYKKDPTSKSAVFLADKKFTMYSNQSKNQPMEPGVTLFCGTDRYAK